MKRSCRRRHHSSQRSPRRHTKSPQTHARQQYSKKVRKLRHGHGTHKRQPRGEVPQAPSRRSKSKQQIQHEQSYLLLVGVHHGLRHSLPLVVAGPGPDGVHVAPVRFPLRVLLRISVDLGADRTEKSGRTENISHLWYFLSRSSFTASLRPSSPKPPFVDSRVGSSTTPNRAHGPQKRWARHRPRANHAPPIAPLRTSEVLVRSILAPVLLASPSMFSVPWVLVLIVLIGLYW